MPMKGAPKGMHKMPSGKVMSDAEMKAMMGAKKPAKKGKSKMY